MPLENKKRCSRRTKDGPVEGWRELQDRLQVLQETGGTAEEDPFDLEDVVPKALQNKYKGRERVDGCLLHFAIEVDSQTPGASQGVEAESTERVLQAGARPDSWAMYWADGNEQAKFGPVHLAAGLGVVHALQLLHKYNADINQKTLRNENEHYTAVHEACFMARPEALECLLKLRADANLTNKMGETPLHIVAKNGNAAIAELLVTYGARLDVTLPSSNARASERRSHFMKSMSSSFTKTFTFLSEGDEALGTSKEEGFTPLEIAIRGERRFPKDKLHLLAPFCHEGYNADLLSGIASMCQANMPAAKELLRSLRDQDQARISQLIEDFCQAGTGKIDLFADMITLAPEVALDFLSMMLCRPQAQAPEYHALPVMANFEETQEWVLALHGKRLRNIHTAYTPDLVWKYKPEADEGNKFPHWHELLAPPPSGSPNDFEASMKVLQFPNILDIRILHAMNCLRMGNVKLYERFFTTQVVGALVTCGWKYVRAAVYLETALDFLVVLILTHWAMELDRNGLGANPRYHSWSIISATVIRELFNKCYVMRSAMSWGFPVRSHLRTNNMLDFLLTLTLGTFVACCNTIHESPWSAMLFCLNVLLRWFKLAHMLRLVSGVGEKILAITTSVFPMAEFFIFAGIIYGAFAAAFASIRGRNSLQDVGRALFFIVFAGDVEAFQDLEGLDGHGVLTFGLVSLVTLVFSVAILNLMIAMYGNMYTTYEAKAGCLFLQEGALYHSLGDSRSLTVTCCRSGREEPLSGSDDASKEGGFVDDEEEEEEEGRTVQNLFLWTCTRVDRDENTNPFEGKVERMIGAIDARLHALDARVVRLSSELRQRAVPHRGPMICSACGGGAGGGWEEPSTGRDSAGSGSAVGALSSVRPAHVHRDMHREAFARQATSPFLMRQATSPIVEVWSAGVH